MKSIRFPLCEIRVHAPLHREKAQIESVLINNPAIWALGTTGQQRITQFSSVESDLSTSSEGDMPMAELNMTIEVEFFQDADDFFPIPVVPLQGVDVAQYARALTRR